MTEHRPDPERRAWRTDAEWTQLSRRIAAANALREQPAWTRLRVPAAAAAVLIATALGVWSLRGPKQAPLPFTIVQTVAGQPRTFALEDGTRVDLAPASTLRYRLTAGTRELSLVGAARFTVVHDAARPFVVQAGRARVTDIGTVFQVSAHTRDSFVAVSVSEGEVALRDSTSPAEITLRAGTGGFVDAMGAVKRAQIPAAQDTAWIGGTLQFTNAELTDVARTLSRWFDVDITVSDRTLGQRRITALYAAPTLDDVLAALAATTNARVVHAQGRITLVAR